MNTEERNCQNCKQSFVIEPDDFSFYEKMKVPAPTWCPMCRYKRRAIWRNARHLFRNVDSVTNEEVFSGINKDVKLKLYNQSYWNSDAWDPHDYGRDYDFSNNFFEQLSKLLYEVPHPAKSMQRCIDSDYSNMCDDMKNTYLCFNATFMEDSAYCCNGSVLKKCFDLTSCYNSESCYDNVRVDKSYNTISSINSENCIDSFFLKNCVGCSNCIGCVNLRNSSYCIFNEQYSKEEYLKEINSMHLDTWQGYLEVREKSENFWIKFPIKYMLGFRNFDVLGEDIKDSKNVKYSYIVHQGQNLKYVQDVPFGGASDSYDYTCWGISASQLYECMIVGEQVDKVKFSFECWPACQELEYCIQMRRCKNCFACVGMKDSEYCIFNKQYSKDEYFNLVDKIKKHMDEMPYINDRGIVYKYGEFFPIEMSPYAYNETLLNDQFPSNKENAEREGFIWRDQNRRQYQATILGVDLPESINEISEEIIKELIECVGCNKAFRVIHDEFNFLKNLKLPIPRYCVDCRFARRQKFMVPPLLNDSKCMCGGKNSSNGVYENLSNHESHDDNMCTNTFLTAYNLDNEIIYCESCYQREVI